MPATRRWVRADTVTICGGANCAKGMPFIQPDDPMLLIQLSGVRVPLIRCVRCADEPPPPGDIPLHHQRAAMLRPGVRAEWDDEGPELPPNRLRTTVARLSSVHLPFDARMAAAGGREPGEDG
jgi:hypothetical protein